MKNPSLDEFARQHGGRRAKSWCDDLPDDVKAQIVASDASTALIVRWLMSLGHAEASYGKVDGWRRTQRERPTDAG
jgi:hypothetical protein